MGKKIQSNMSYLQKLFIMPDKPDKFVQFGRDLLEMIRDFFQEAGGIHSSISLPELSRIFDRTRMPRDPALVKDVLKEIREKIIAHSVKVGNPYYIGHMTSAIPYFMVLMEMIIAALNQNQVKIETAKASSFVEKELVAWFHRLIFDRSERFYQRQIQNPRVALGNVTADGTLGNITSLLVAREKAFPPDGAFPGVRQAGMSGALRYYEYERGVILVSVRGHYSIRKAAGILGLGEQNVIAVGVDGNHRIDVGKLGQTIRRLQAPSVGGGRTKIIAVVGIAGTTETGNVDPLDRLGDIARDNGAHFHVDACWGGAALMVDGYSPLFKGIERADSVTIDAHKLLYCPTAMGLVLFRDEKDLDLTKQASQYIIRKDSVDIGRFTIEGSRPFSCLKTWASLKIIGREGYGLLLKKARENTAYMKSRLDGNDYFETLNRPELFILIYRFIPKNVRDGIGLRQAAGRHHKKRNGTIDRKKISSVNRLLNDLNIRLHRELRRDDRAFVSRTMCRMKQYGSRSLVVLRAVLINPLTSHQIIDEIVAIQERIGKILWKEFEPAYQRIVDESND